MKSLCFAAFALALTLSLAAADGKKEKAPKPYPLKTCVVSGLDLGDSPITFTYEDREIKICCDQCQEDFYKEPQHFVEKLEMAEKAKKTK
ncbi:MAG: hypothetical protein AB1705_11655 [Verrucomicrobiota bacterium]